MATYASPSALKWTLLILNTLIFIAGTFMLVQGFVMFIGVEGPPESDSSESTSLEAVPPRRPSHAVETITYPASEESDELPLTTTRRPRKGGKRTRDIVAALARSERKKSKSKTTTEAPTTTTTTEAPSEERSSSEESGSSSKSQSDSSGSSSSSSSSEEDDSDEPRFPSVGNSVTIILFATLILIVSGLGCMGVLQENVGLIDAYGYGSFISSFVKLLFVFGSIKMHAGDEDFDPMDSITVIGSVVISVIEMVLGMASCQYAKLLKRGDAADPHIEPLPSKV